MCFSGRAEYSQPVHCESDGVYSTCACAILNAHENLLLMGSASVVDLINFCPKISTKQHFVKDLLFAHLGLSQPVSQLH